MQYLPPQDLVLFSKQQTCDNTHENRPKLLSNSAQHEARWERRSQLSGRPDTAGQVQPRSSACCNPLFFEIGFGEYYLTTQVTRVLNLTSRDLGGPVKRQTTRHDDPGDDRDRSRANFPALPRLGQHQELLEESRRVGPGGGADFGHLRHGRQHQEEHVDLFRRGVQVRSRGGIANNSVPLSASFSQQQFDVFGPITCRISRAFVKLPVRSSSPSDRRPCTTCALGVVSNFLDVHVNPLKKIFFTFSVLCKHSAHKYIFHFELTRINRNIF